jgi:hypothetical protein
MDRRAFIGALAGGLLAAPLAAGAQQGQPAGVSETISSFLATSAAEREPATAV